MQEIPLQDVFEDLTDVPQQGCPFCGAAESCSHHVARFDEGVSTRLEDALSEVRDGLWSLVAATRRSVATDSPRPLALRMLPGGGRFLARIEQAWHSLAEHARNDGDLDGWLAVLEADTDSDVANWIAHGIWALGDAPVVTSADEGVECWYCEDPRQLQDRIRAGLAGEPAIGGVADPLRLAI
ncbi:MAG: hypothetical protein MK085_03590 [Phycisphaerales bacterium]|nr:hypothetical protein [Phycisphaerales bacterium]